MGSKLRQKKANGDKMKQREQNGTSGRMNENFDLMKQNPKLKPKRGFSKGNNWRKRNMETKGKGANWGGERREPRSDPWTFQCGQPRKVPRSAPRTAAIRADFSAAIRANFRAVSLPCPRSAVTSAGPAAISAPLRAV